MFRLTHVCRSEKHADVNSTESSVLIILTFGIPARISPMPGTRTRTRTRIRTRFELETTHPDTRPRIRGASSLGSTRRCDVGRAHGSPGCASGFAPYGRVRL